MFKELTILISSLFIAIAVVVTPLVLVTEFWGRSGCADYKLQTGKETKYSNWHGCFVDTSQGWMIWSEYKQAITGTLKETK